MIPLKYRWISQGTVSLAEDLNLLHLMKQSGCEGLEYVITQTHKIVSIFKRFWGIPPWKRTFLGWQLYWGVNFANRKRFKSFHNN